MGLQGAVEERKWFTHEIDRALWTGDTARIIFDHVRCFEDTLHGACLHIELVVAEAITAVVYQSAWQHGL